MKFRKKPVVIEAFHLSKDSRFDFYEWARLVGFEYVAEQDGTLSIHTLEGWMTAQPDDWIIRGVKGEFYPCKPDIFALTYEPVSETHWRELADRISADLAIDGAPKMHWHEWQAVMAALKAHD